MTCKNYQFPFDHECLDVINWVNVIHRIDHNFPDLKKHFNFNQGISQILQERESYT